MNSTEMLKTLLLSEIQQQFGSIPDDLMAKIKFIQKEDTLKTVYRKLPECRNIFDLRNSMKQKHPVYGRNGLKYQQNYDAMIKWIANEFSGKTLDIFGITTQPITEVFTLEPVEIHVHTGRLDIVFKDESDEYYHCEEQRHLTIDDLYRSSIYHFQTARQLGNAVTDILLISGHSYAGPHIIETKSGTYKPLLIDLSYKNGHNRLNEIKADIQNNIFDSLIELIFIPLYGKERGQERSQIAIDVIDFEIELLKKDKIYQNLVFATLVMCNKLVDTETLRKYYEEVKYMLDILEIAKEDGMKQGMQQGMREMVIAALNEKIGAIPSYLVDKINTITQTEKLTNLIRQAVKCNDLIWLERQLAMPA
ncbi:MAG: hypothetical protein HQK75_01005 [Candidatus Magnetomorum sp.]|nr:hypothetical protein [Candidatus Magnetomorum sp.]